jgi:hypothetical protein
VTIRRVNNDSVPVTYSYNKSRRVGILFDTSDVLFQLSVSHTVSFIYLLLRAVGRLDPGRLSVITPALDAIQGELRLPRRIEKIAERRTRKPKMRGDQKAPRWP